MNPPQRIVVSRSDGIGDVVLALPVFGLLRERWPDAELCLLGRANVAAVAAACVHVDRFAAWPEDRAGGGKLRTETLAALDADVILHLLPRPEIAVAARRARIPRRIGTNRRPYHWFTCTEWVNVGRRRSGLHEAQLNVRLAAPLLGRTDYALSELARRIGLARTQPLEPRWAALLDRSRFNLLLQPLTRGSVPPWPLERFAQLIAALPPERYRVFLTGSAQEGEALRPWLATLPAHVTDVMGQSLEQLIAFIRAADGMVAASTGPLHLAAALGRRAVGLYPAAATRPPVRWSPLGEKAELLLAPTAPTPAGVWNSIEDIPVGDVLAVVDRWRGDRDREP